MSAASEPRGNVERAEMEPGAYSAEGADAPPGGVWPECSCPLHRKAQTVSEAVARANARSRGERL